MQDGEDGPFTLHYNDYKDGSSKVGKPEKLEVDVVIGADGANSRVAKEIDAGDYDYAIAFQASHLRSQPHAKPAPASCRRCWRHRKLSDRILKVARSLLIQLGMSHASSFCCCCGCCN